MKHAKISLNTNDSYTTTIKPSSNTQGLQTSLKFREFNTSFSNAKISIPNTGDDTCHVQLY